MTNWKLLGALVLFDSLWFLYGAGVYVASAYLLLFLLFIPGFLAVSVLNLDLSAARRATYAVGLSVFFLLILGLVLNSALPPLGIGDPLSGFPALAGMNALVLLLVALNRNRPPVRFHIVSGWLLLPLLIPVLAAAGANTLNNGGSPALAIAVFVVAAGALPLLLRVSERLRGHFYPMYIGSLALAILLAYSLRSHYVSGWDVNQEYYAYMTTYSRHFWSPSTYQNAYNACLSITMLPTIVGSLTHISGNVIFKVFYPAVFCFVPIVMYNTFTRFMSSRLALLSAIFFCSQWAFMNVYPALTREMTALLFLALLMDIIDSSAMSKVDYALFFSFTAAVVLSHYGTAYVLVGLLICFYGLGAITRYFSRKKDASEPLVSVNALMVGFAIATVLLWNVGVTNTIGGVGRMVQTSFSDSVHFESQSGGAAIGIVGLLTGSRPSGAARVQAQFSALQENLDPATRAALGLYTAAEAGGFRVVQVTDKYPRPVSAPAHTILRWIALGITALFGVFGLMGASRSLFRRRQSVTNQILFRRAVAGGLLLFLVLLVPGMASYFGPVRAFQQSLILLAPLFLVGGVFVLKALRHREVICACLIAVFFAFQSSLVQGIVRGAPLIADSYVFSNSGSYYNFYYTQDAEVSSARWLGRQDPATVYADDVAALRLKSFAGIRDSRNAIKPSSITKTGYVYLDYRNWVQKAVEYDADNLYYLKYRLPERFLNSNKDLIYNNGSSAIYK